MTMNALIVGGTGPTGPFLIKGLLERGYAVKILHRGTHEIPEIPAEVKHIHADPHFRETLDEALAREVFDLVIATYGRLRFVAEAVVGKTNRFIGIGGVSAYRGYLKASSNFPVGLATPVPEDAPWFSPRRPRALKSRRRHRVLAALQRKLQADPEFLRCVRRVSVPAAALEAFRSTRPSDAGI